MRSSDVRIKMSKRPSQRHFLCFSLGRTSPAALSLRSTAPWCSEISGRGLGLMIRITRYGCLCKVRRGREWSGVGSHRTSREKSVYCSLYCVFLSCFSLAQAVFSWWWALGGALRRASGDAFLIGSGSSPWGGRAVGGRGLWKLLHFSLTFPV